MRIGILALQGAFAEHGLVLGRLGIEHFEIRKRQDLEEKCNGIIIPGGESTVIGKLLKDLHLFDLLKIRIEEGLPVFGTCAGLLLLAKDIEGEEPLGFCTMDIKAKRNAYGRQLGSFYTENEFQGIGKVPMTFIRGPYILGVSKDVEVLAKESGRIVAAKQGNQLVTAFHPELSEDYKIHQYFIDMVKKNE